MLLFGVCLWFEFVLAIWSNLEKKNDSVELASISLEGVILPRFPLSHFGSF